MRLALIGLDADTRRLARALARSPRHELVWACEVAGRTRAGDLEAGVTISDDWQSLLVRSVADAVIVGRAEDEELRADQLRKLVQEGVPLLVMHPVIPSVLIYYELDSMREETGGVLLPYLPWRSHPAVIRLIELARGEGGPSLGTLQQIEFQRPLADRTKQAVLDAFARDVDLIRAISGEVTRLVAMGSGRDDAAYANLGVQMSGASPVVSRWTVEPADDGAAGRVILRGERGKAVLEMPEDSAWRLTLSSASGTQHDESPPWDPADEALGQLTDAVSAGGRAVTAADWADALRSMELAEGAERSVRRGRAVELRVEQRSEEGAFKGVMTSLGCGVICLGVAVMTVASFAEFAARGLGLERVAAVINNAWAILLLVLLALFLGLQLLKLVFRAEKKDADSRAEDPD